MLNGVHEIGLSEAYNVKVNNYPGATRCSKEGWRFCEEQAWFFTSSYGNKRHPE